jgi:hypothetical protein
MQYDFSQLEEPTDLRTIPEGTYPCRIREVREGKARDGSPRWSLRLEVAEGELAGRHAAWDSLTWSERGVHRVRTVLAALGFEVDGVLAVEPSELVGRCALVELAEETWEDPQRGIRRQQLTVPYAGWRSLANAQPSPRSSDGEFAAAPLGGTPRGSRAESAGSSAPRGQGAVAALSLEEGACTLEDSPF